MTRMKRDDSHEFHSSEPLAEPAIALRPGDRAPEAGPFACQNCEAVTATLITMEKDEALPLCQTCGRMTLWAQP